MTQTSSDSRGAVTLDGIVKRYGDATAVNGVSLDVQSGEFHSLLGPSGCGKTTLLRMIAGFEHPDEGDILLGGQSMLGDPPHKRPVNTVFQAYALFPHMSVSQNVAYGLRQRRTPRSEIGQKVAEALDMVRMRDFADRNPKALSGGQQQRVALARALVNRPDVLLLDEPMSALDRKLREEMQLELKLLQKRLGITFIFVTHDQEEALSMSDRIVVMHDGQVEQTGQAEEIYAQPASAFVAGFIGKQNFITATVDRVDGERAVVLDGVDGRLHSTAPRHAQGTADLRPGQSVQATIRPEALTLSAEEPTGTNVLAARVAGVSFLGDVVQYVAVTDSGLELLARMPRARAVSVHTDDRVFCHAEPDQVQVFAK